MALEALLASRHQVVAVYTQPDRPAGRGRRTTASPVKQLAVTAGIAVRQPASLRGIEEQQQLAALEADLMVVVAYGLILPAAVLALPRLGCVNVHASLLPRWRGAAPIQRAILAGDTEVVEFRFLAPRVQQSSTLLQIVDPLRNNLVMAEDAQTLDVDPYDFGISDFTLQGAVYPFDPGIGFPVITNAGPVTISGKVENLSRKTGSVGYRLEIDEADLTPHIVPGGQNLEHHRPDGAGGADDGEGGLAARLRGHRPVPP